MKPTELEKKMFRALEARVKELESAGELALRYLENPEVRAISFALHVDAASKRLRAAISRSGSESEAAK